MKGFQRNNERMWGQKPAWQQSWGTQAKLTLFRIIKFALKDEFNLPDKIQSVNSAVRRMMRCSRANLVSSLTDLRCLLKNTNRSIFKMFELSWFARIGKLSEFQCFLQLIRREHYTRTLCWRLSTHVIDVNRIVSRRKILLSIDWRGKPVWEQS